MDRIEDWAARGVCRTMDPDYLFVLGAAQNRAKAICLGCPVRTECLADSLDQRIEFGVWGGLTERERRALLQRRPNVTSWRHLLETARDEHATAHDVVPSLTAVPTLTPAAVPSPPAVPVRPLAPSLPAAS